MRRDLVEGVRAMKGKKILVIGDMVADIYLDGRISRISREAPVLVLEQAGERIVAGGAANVVNNVATLGGDVYGVGVLGHDSAADGLVAVLNRNGAHTDGLIRDEGRPTISKTRVIAGGRATVSQQIVRIDKESKEPISPEKEEELLKYIDSILSGMEGIVLSDYGAGTITPRIQERLISFARDNGIPSIVDSRYDIKRFCGIKYVKQNDAELASAVGRDLLDEADLCDAGRELLSVLDAEGILVTRGERGMSLFERNGVVTHVPVTDKSEVFDVSGAGDTCVSAVILALAGGVSPQIATEISNYASGIAVRKLGTSTVSDGELLRVLRADDAK